MGNRGKGREGDRKKNVFYKWKLVNLIKNREVKQTSVSNLCALQGFHIIYNMLAQALVVSTTETKNNNEFIVLPSLKLPKKWLSNSNNLFCLIAVYYLISCLKFKLDQIFMFMYILKIFGRSDRTSFRQIQPAIPCKISGSLKEIKLTSIISLIFDFHDIEEGYTYLLIKVIHVFSVSTLTTPTTVSVKITNVFPPCRSFNQLFH